MDKAEVEEIAKEVSRRDNKALSPKIWLTMALVIIGWIYQIGIAKSQQDNNTAAIKENTVIVKQVGVIQNDINHLKNAIIEMKSQQRIDKSEILDAIKFKHREP